MISIVIISITQNCTFCSIFLFLLFIFPRNFRRLWAHRRPAVPSTSPSTAQQYQCRQNAIFVLKLNLQERGDFLQHYMTWKILFCLKNKIKNAGAGLSAQPAPQRDLSARAGNLNHYNIIINNNKSTTTTTTTTAIIPTPTRTTTPTTPIPTPASSSSSLSWLSSSTTGRRNNRHYYPAVVELYGVYVCVCVCVCGGGGSPSCPRPRTSSGDIINDTNVTII